MEIAASMADVLRAKEARTHVHRSLLDAPEAACVVELTVVSPGAVKDSTRIRDVFRRGVAAVSAAFAHTSTGLGTPRVRHHLAGPHAAWPCQLPPNQAKRLAIDVENRPGGRLWDVDVLAPDLRPVSRTALGVPPRSCLLCDAPAAACARSGRHPLAEVQAAILRLTHQLSSADVEGVGGVLTRN